MTDASAPRPDIEKLRALLGRVEKATGPDREIDEDIFHDVDRPDVERPEPGWRNCGVRPFTASIDAALALVERVLPRQQIEFGRYYATDGFSPEGCAARVSEYAGGDGPRFEEDASWAATLPLAILAALVRAKIAEASYG